jgi:hypothetical protein
MADTETDRGDAQEPEVVETWESALKKTFEASTADDTSTEETGTPPAAETAKAVPEKVGESQVAESQDALQPLEKWTDDVKTKFSTLDKGLQQFLLDRHKELEGDYTTKTQEVADSRRKYEKLDEVLKPYDEIAKRQGADLAPHIAQALQLYMNVQRDPLAVVRNYVVANKLTPEQLGLVGADPNEDPSIGALRSTLEQTRAELALLRQGQIQQSDAQLTDQIQAFRNAKDESGAAKYPHFEKVRVLMAPLVEQGKSLAQAYEDTVWTLPEHRQVALKADLEKAEKDAKKEADKARMEKVRKAKTAETLPASDAEKGTSRKNLKEVGGWLGALSETAKQLGH